MTLSRLSMRNAIFSNSLRKRFSDVLGNIELSGVYMNNTDTMAAITITDKPT